MKAFIQQRIGGHYAAHPVQAPLSIERREFGAGVDQKIDFRHLSFRDERALNTYVKTFSPLYLSYSAAYYQYPEGRPMPRKGWRGADLVFDLDADEYENPCEHDSKFVCEVCMSRVKEELVKLVEGFLIPDFGFARGELSINFSGNRGYHVHVRSEHVRQLSQRGRRELLDYIYASGLSSRAVGFRRVDKSMRGPSPGDAGWGGRVARLFKSMVEAGDAGALARAMGVSLKTSSKIINSRESVVAGLEQGSWDQVPISEKTWDKAVRLFASGVSAEVDKNVTMDVSRLMRLPTSIHGGTGFEACHVKSLDAFDPFRDPVVLGDEVFSCVALKDAEFLLKDQTFSLGAGRKADLPEFAAVFAAAKGLVTVDGF
ncbi:MAG: DNA primase catalytic subunit PriS [Candidatus Diapherotrites archaeon]|nr:DNA primase catalytic subunit PriS [Candidatus Diapherotrites archaeon]